MNLAKRSLPKGTATEYPVPLGHVSARRWLDRYHSAMDRSTSADSVDLDQLVAGMETVYEYHLASRD